MALCTSLLAPAAGASELFRFGEVEGIFNFSAAWGILARVEDRDPDIVGIGNGGNAPSVNSDDGNLNYGEGPVANQVRGSAELELRWKALSAFVRGYGFYDFEHEHGDDRRTGLGHDADRVVGRGAGFQDYYLTADLDVADVPLQLRLGNQVINWGESNFVRFGIDVVNPIDLVAVAQPTTTVRDAFVRQGMLWGVANLTESLALEAFYQYDWQPVGLPPTGWFFSGDDLVGTDVNLAFEGFGEFSDLGTDLDAAFSPTVQPLGFDRNFMKIPSRGRDVPDDQGQFGFAAQLFLPVLNSTKLSLYFVNYHSRLPLVNGYTADAASAALTSDAAVDALAATYGVTRADAELLAVSDLANATRFGVTYPENMRMLGVGFSTATITTGTLIGGEVSHHFDWPVQVPKDEVIVASLSPVEFTSPLADVFQGTSLGSFGPEQKVKGWFFTEKTQLSVNVAQLLGPRLGASQSLLSFDVAWAHVDGLPGSSPFDEDSWGYRLVGRLTYEGVFGGFSVSPLLRFTHDVHGVTPGPGGAFVEERKTITAALDVQYTQSWTGTLSYVRDFDGIRINGVPANLLKDRDWVRFSVTYHH